jgi:hypothetical protein
MALNVEVCDGVTGALCDAAGAVVGGVGAPVFDAVFVALGAAFVASAQDLVAATLAALDASTQVDLSAGWFSRNLGVLAAVSLPVVVGLFVVQVIGSVLRREPGGLVRAVVGVGKATVGAAVAIAATKVALTATDGICAAIAAQSAGTSVTGAARRFLDLTWLAGPGTGPVLQMLLASAVMVGVVLLWGVLLFRKAAILLVAVFAPIAFAGSAWDQTRVWTRRWIETVIALVFCKVVIVVVFVLGVAAFGSTGSTGTGAPQALGAQLSDVIVGLLLLGLAVFAPWMTFRFVHWSGVEAGTAMHHQMVATPIPAAATGVARSGRFAAQSAATTLLVGAVTGGTGAPAAAAATAACPAARAAAPAAAGGVR